MTAGDSRPQTGKQPSGVQDRHFATIVERLIEEKGLPEFPDVSKKGAVDRESLANVRVFMDWSGLKVWSDTFSKKTYVEGIPSHEVWDDTALFVVRSSATLTGLKVSKDALNDHVKNIAGEMRRDPLKEYLDRVQAEWDGVDRVSGWLEHYANAECTDEQQREYVNAVGELVLVAGVRRARQEGCKFDHCLVLESAQGAGKSTLCEMLVPDPDWFTSNLRVGAEAKEIIETTSGKWVCEIEELSGMAKREVEAVKAFISRRVDGARLAYARDNTERARRFILIGTTNNDKYLMDGTGNRRFLPLKITGRIDGAAIARDRDQLWGQAASLEANEWKDRPLFLDESLWPVAAREQEERRLVSASEEVLEEALGGIEAGFIASGEIRKIVFSKAGPMHANQDRAHGEALRRLGWERHQLGGGKRIWRKGDTWRDRELVCHEDSGTVVNAKSVRGGGFDESDAAGEF